MTDDRAKMESKAATHTIRGHCEPRRISMNDGEWEVAIPYQD